MNVAVLKLICLELAPHVTHLQVFSMQHVKWRTDRKLRNIPHSELKSKIITFNELLCITLRVVPSMYLYVCTQLQHPIGRRVEGETLGLWHGCARQQEV